LVLRREALMLSWLAKFLTAPIIGGFLNAYKAKLAAANDSDRIAADLAGKAIEAEIARRNAQRDLGIASMSHPVWWIAWGLFVIPVGLYHASIFVLSILSIGPDVYAVLKVPPDQQELSRTIIQYLFLAQGGAGVAGALIQLLAKR
jgi:hypothetical protein